MRELLQRRIKTNFTSAIKDRGGCQHLGALITRSIWMAKISIFGSKLGNSFIILLIICKIVLHLVCASASSSSRVFFKDKPFHRLFRASSCRFPIRWYKVVANNAFVLAITTFLNLSLSKNTTIHVSVPNFIYLINHAKHSSVWHVD